MGVPDDAGAGGDDVSDPGVNNFEKNEKAFVRGEAEVRGFGVVDEYPFVAGRLANRALNAGFSDENR